MYNDHERQKFAKRLRQLSDYLRCIATEQEARKDEEDLNYELNLAWSEMSPLIQELELYRDCMQIDLKKNKAAHDKHQEGLWWESYKYEKGIKE